MLTSAPLKKARPLFKSDLTLHPIHRKGIGRLDSKLSEVEHPGADFSNTKPINVSFDFNRMAIQPKLNINTPGDQYEQEADRVADQIMQMPEPTVQRKCAKCAEEEEETIQTKPLAIQNTPFVQRQVDREEEDET